MKFASKTQCLICYFFQLRDNCILFILKINTNVLAPEQFTSFTAWCVCSCCHAVMLPNVFQVTEIRSKV